MSIWLTKTKALFATGVMAGTGAVGMVAAGPAAALAGTVCMSHHQFYDALSTGAQHGLYRGGQYKWGIRDVRCDQGWASALAIAKGDHGSSGYAFTATEHRSARGNWYQIDRTKPCRTHEVPKKIYSEFCESN